MKFEQFWIANLSKLHEGNTRDLGRLVWEAAIKAEREACCKAIDKIDDGQDPVYRACQEAIRERK